MNVDAKDVASLVAGLPRCRFCGVTATHVQDTVYPPSRAPGRRLRYYNAETYCRACILKVRRMIGENRDIEGKRFARIRPIEYARALRRVLAAMP